MIKIQAKDLNRKIPKYFYLVFEIPTHSSNDPLTWAKDIVKGEMKGVAGVSADTQVIQTFGYRHGLLVMDGKEFIKLNKISRFQYSNPHYLVQDNLAALYRIWDKIPGTKNGQYDVMLNLGMQVIKNSKNEKFKDLALFHSIYDRVALYYMKSSKKFKGIKDLSSWLYAAFDFAMTKGGYTRIMDMKTTISKKDFHNSVVAAIKKTGEIYSTEKEWIIKDKVLRIPSRSKVRVYAMYEKDFLSKVNRAMRGLVEDTEYWLGSARDTAEHLAKANKILRGYKFDNIEREKAQHNLSAKTSLGNDIMLYHGTVVERARKIIRDGYLKWHQTENWDEFLTSMPNRVYFARDASLALEMAGSVSDKEKDLKGDNDKYDPAIVVVSLSTGAELDEDTVANVLEHVYVVGNTKRYFRLKKTLSQFRNFAKSTFLKIIPSYMRVIGEYSNSYSINTDEMSEALEDPNIERSLAKMMRVDFVCRLILAKAMIKKGVPKNIERLLLLNRYVRSLAITGKVPVKEAYDVGINAKIYGASITDYRSLVRSGKKIK